MSGREIPYEANAKCDTCGARGAYDVMGDYFCENCMNGFTQEESALDQLLRDWHGHGDCNDNAVLDYEGAMTLGELGQAVEELAFLRAELTGIRSTNKKLALEWEAAIKANCEVSKLNADYLEQITTLEVELAKAREVIELTALTDGAMPNDYRARMAAIAYLEAHPETP